MSILTNLSALSPNLLGTSITKSNSPTALEGAASLATSFAAHLRQSEETAIASMAGKASSHDLATALAQSQLSVEAATAVRNKVVESYQEILRMPI